MGGDKVYRHEQSQNAQLRQLQSLEGRTDYLEQRLQQVTEYYNVQPEYRDDAYNYLAIGNSLTLITSWGRGICATQPDGDYFGLVKAHLSENHNDVTAYRINFSSWERMGERRQSLDLLNMLLSDKLNLVTIQLGENVSDTSRFEADLEELISYVQQRAPKAQIIIIGDFWDKERNNMRKEAAQNKSVTFVDLSAIIGDKSYQSKEGTPCLLDDGSTMIVSKAAETHPGDKGMAYISDKVIEKIHE
ncbi:SGNH/GDSL hydrolase family protein [Mitsuokella jalaludinii]|uniref:SGNH/GDSL hydrolase family protein n=1 Tax=Mitsuokella jalaludinii TaxID=187979 RepID=UPI003F8B0849